MRWLASAVPGLGQSSLAGAVLFPCVAIKFPRGHGRRSANLLFSAKKRGQSSLCFFDEPLCTAVKERADHGVIRTAINSFR